MAARSPDSLVDLQAASWSELLSWRIALASMLLVAGVTLFCAAFTQTGEIRRLWAFWGFVLFLLSNAALWPKIYKLNRLAESGQLVGRPRRIVRSLKTIRQYLANEPD